MSKSVGIVGAGVSGLVSAVNMLKVGINPIVFEKAADLGGMWNSNLKPCWNSMRVNVSKFCTSLADCPWNRDASLFPDQRQVFEYLLNYAEKTLSKEMFRFNCHVIKVDYSESRWIIDYRTKSNEILREKFDFLIIASGFFDQPYLPTDIVNLSSFRGQVLHSCDYRSPEQIKNRRVILAGASMSAAELVSDMANSAEHIIHIVSHCFYSLPRLRPLMPTDPATPFLPGDLVSFRRSNRKTMEENVLLSKEANRFVHERLRLVTSDEQKSSKLIDANDESPVYIAVSDFYAEWCRSEKISLKQGRLVKVNDDGTLVLNNGQTIETNSNDVLVLCTGYRPCLDFFSKDILEKLSYQSNDIFSPLILHRTVFHPELKNLAFIGMYRGPFWPIIELQSRWVASIFSGRLPLPSLDVQQVGLNMEERIREQRPRPQFPRVDFVGNADELARDVFGASFVATNDFCSSIDFHPNGPDQTVVDEVNQLSQDANNGRFVAGAVFRALFQSKWSFERILTGKPSNGTVHGQCQFLPINSNELLYKEQGKLLLPSQIPLDITQKYLYHYDEKQDILTVYFVDENNQRTNLFHQIRFQPKDTSDLGWIARGEHLCSQDHYSTSYLFAFKGIELSHFEINYQVKGPNKDYLSKTIFQKIKN